MIDYDATLQVFFYEVTKFLMKRKAEARDVVELKRIEKAISVVGQIAENPELYADYNMRFHAGLELRADAFVSNRNDDSVYLMCNQVLNSVGNLRSQFDWCRKGARENLLQSCKQMQRKNAENIFKSVSLSMLPLRKFGVEKQH